jgi:hypothetical protein
MLWAHAMDWNVSIKYIKGSRILGIEETRGIDLNPPDFSNYSNYT